MKNAIFIFLLAFAGALNAQTVTANKVGSSEIAVGAVTSDKSTADTVTPIEAENGTRMQVTLIYPDGSRRMDYIKISQNKDYFYLALPTGRVRYSKLNDVATQHEGRMTYILLSNYWVKVQLILDANQLVAVDGSLRDVVDGKSVKIYDFQFGE